MGVHKRGLLQGVLGLQGGDDENNDHGLLSTVCKLDAL